VIAEHHIAVQRSARYFTLGAAGADVNEVWFALHGYGQLASSFARHCSPLEAPGRLVVVPEALSRFYLGDHTRPAGPDARIGASWMTRDDRGHEISDYVHYLDQLYHTVCGELGSKVSTHVLGFSQGTATATRWVTQGHVPASRLIIWGAPLPSDLDMVLNGERLRSMEIVLVAGDRDEFYTPKVLKADEGRLEGIGARFRVIRYAGGHALDADTLRKLT